MVCCVDKLFLLNVPCACGMLGLARVEETPTELPTLTYDQERLQPVPGNRSGSSSQGSTKLLWLFTLPWQLHC